MTTQTTKYAIGSKGEPWGLRYATEQAAQDAVRDYPAELEIYEIRTVPRKQPELFDLFKGITL